MIRLTLPGFFWQLGLPEFSTWLPHPNRLTGQGGLAKKGAPSVTGLPTPLACFGVGGTDSRVYYLANNRFPINPNNIWELARDNGWSSPEPNTT